MKGIGLTLADKWLIGILLMIAISGIVASLVFFSGQTNVSAEIRVDGKLIKTIPLRQGYREELRIGGKTEYAIIEANDGKIRIRQDDSPRQIGVQTGWISKAPEQVINLPYRIVITLVSSAELDIDGIAR
ncbi:MAG: hypothetical protein H6Q73_3934 [Firmicutes bacterium]|nr:hypothetical protein [Bacillota bacterium]